MKKKKILIGSFLMATASFLGGVAVNAMGQNSAVTVKADVTPTTVGAVDLEMKNGASVRYASSADGSGIRFSMNLSSADYLGLEANQGSVYTSVNYGMAIMPYSYLDTYGELTEENLFGKTAKYDWAVYDETTGEWVYTGDNTTKKRIIMLSHTEMVVDSDDTGKYVFSGSMSGIQEDNLARDFVGRGYIKAVKADGTIEYLMADYTGDNVHNNVRSIVEVAEKAVADEKLTDQDKINALVNYYIDATNVRTVKFYDGENLISVHETKKNYAFNDVVLLDGDDRVTFSHWEDENGVEVTADTTYEITGITKFYAVYTGNGTDYESVKANATETINSFLSMTVTQGNLTEAQAQYEAVKTAIDALRASDYNEMVTAEVRESINAKVEEINTVLATSDDLYEQYSGTLYEGDAFKNAVTYSCDSDSSKTMNFHSGAYSDSEGWSDGICFDVGGNDGLTWTINFPAINYAAYQTVSFEWCSSDWAGFGVQGGDFIAQSGTAYSGTVVIKNNGDNTITVTVTESKTGATSVATMDITATVQFKMIASTYRRICFSKVTATSLYDVWSVEGSATLYEGDMLKNNVSGVNNSTSASASVSTGLVDETKGYENGINVDFGNTQNVALTVNLPKINYSAYTTVSMNWCSTESFMSLGVKGASTKIAASWSYTPNGTITVTNNGDGTIDVVITDSSSSTTATATVSDSAIVSGQSALQLETYTWSWRRLCLSEITATLDLNGRMEVAKGNGKTPKLLSATVSDAISVSCDSSAGSSVINLPLLNYSLYEQVTFDWNIAGGWTFIGPDANNRWYDQGTALGGAVTIVNNGNGTLSLIMTQTADTAKVGTFTSEITDVDIINGTKALTLSYECLVGTQTFATSVFTASYKMSAESIEGISYEEKETIFNAPYFTVVEKVVSESVSVSCADSTTATPLNLPLINYSLYESVTMDWTVSGWTQTGQGGDLWFYNTGDALGGTVTIVNNGDGTLTFTMTETVVGEGTKSKTITDSAIVNGQAALTLNGKSLVGTQTLTATNITVYNGKEPVSSGPVEYVLKDFSLSTYETAIIDTDDSSRELLVNLYSDGEKVSLEAQNATASDSTENTYTVTLPWIDYSALNYVKTTISTNNGKAIGFAQSDMLSLVQYHDTTNDTWPIYDTYLTLTHDNGTLTATLLHQGNTKTVTVTDEDVINGNKGFSFYVKGVAYTGYQLTDLVANGKSGMVIKNVSQDLDLGVQSGETEYSEYRIAWYAHDEWTNDYYNYEFAAEELASFLNRWTGKKYQTVKMYDGQAVEPDSKYIVLGGQLAQEAGLTLDDVTKRNGYKIVQNYTNLYIYSETSEGTLSGLYGFLKKQADVTFYTDEVFTETVTENSATVGADTSLTFNPSFNSAQAGYAEMQYSEEYQRRLGMYADWDVMMGAALKNAATEITETTNDDGTKTKNTTGGHNMLQVFPYETFGETYSDWYVEDDNGNWQLNFTSSNTHLQEMKDMFVASAKVVIAEYSQYEYFEFAQPDSQYGPDVAGYLAFMNDVAATLNAWLATEDPDRTVALVMYAYNATLIAPESGSIYNGDNVYVAVYFAPVGSRYPYKIDAGNNYEKDTDSNTFDSVSVYERLLAWTKLEGFNADRNLIYWMYGTDFYNYMMPMDTLTNLQYNYQKLYETGTDMIKYQFQTKNKDNVGSNWQRLKTYLSAELAKDVNADVATLQANFMSAMYGAGAEYMQQLLSAQQAYCTYDNFNDKDSWLISGTNATEDYFGVINGSVKLMKSNYFTEDTLTAWMGYINDAKLAVNAASLSDEEKAAYIERIEVEALSIRYMLVSLHSNTTYDESVAEWKTHAASLGCYCYMESDTADGNW